jgi:N-acetylneuraminate synthase
MHLADADGFDGEGLQVGEGDIDWFEFAQIMHEFNPQAHFIPEIWQGHKNQGAGAWLALERLEAVLGEVA